MEQLKRVFDFTKSKRTLIGRLAYAAFAVGLIVLIYFLVSGRVDLQEKEKREHEEQVAYVDSVLKSIDRYYSEFTSASGNEARRVEVYHGFLEYKAATFNNKRNNDEIYESLNTTFYNMNVAYYNEYDAIVDTIEHSAAIDISELDDYINDYLQKSYTIYDTFNESGTSGIIFDNEQEPIDRERYVLFNELSEIKDVLADSDFFSDSLIKISSHIEDLAGIKEFIEYGVIFGSQPQAEPLLERIDGLIKTYSDMLTDEKHFATYSEIEALLDRKREWFLGNYNELLREITIKVYDGLSERDTVIQKTGDLMALINLLNAEQIIDTESHDDLYERIRNTIFEYTDSFWLWPMDDYYAVFAGYGWRMFGGEHNYHGGIDVHGSNSEGVDINGAPIRAAKSGMGYFHQVSRTSGRCVIIDHGDNTFSLYAHASRLVGENRFVRQGEIIAYVGSTGRSTAPHLHFEIRTGRDNTNILGNWLKYDLVPNNPIAHEIDHGRAVRTGHISYIYDFPYIP